MIKALVETAVVIAWPLALWLLITKAGLPPQVTVMAGLVVLFAADKYFGDGEEGNPLGIITALQQELGKQGEE